MNRGWFSDIQTAALLTCIATVLSLPMPLWRLMQSIVGIKSETFPRQAILLVPATFLYVAVLPVFCFALYRNKATLRFPPSMCHLGLIAAITLAVSVLIDLPGLVESLVSYMTAMSQLDWRVGGATILKAAGDPRTMDEVSNLFAELSNVAYILLLVALSRQTNDEPDNDVPISHLLAVLTKPVVIAWGIWVAIELIQVLYTPFSYFQFRDLALRMGRTAPTFWSMFAKALRGLLSQASLLVIPYMVLNRRATEQSATGATDSPRTEDSPSDAVS